MRIFPVLVVFAVFAGCGCCLAHEQLPEGSPPPVRLIVDTDMGLDDVRSLFALLSDSHIDLQGIITVEGSASLGKGMDNLIGLLETHDRYDIPLYRGSGFPHGETPAWRETANRLAGVPFPPPRSLTPVGDARKALVHLIEEKRDSIHYLALGPLTNLAWIEKSAPGTLRDLHTIWIPVVLSEDGTVEGWNLFYDRASTEEILRENDLPIILIDLAGKEALRPCRVFAAVKDSTLAARWITKVADVVCPQSHHQIISDELAAAVLLDPQLMTLSSHAYRVGRGEGDALRIDSMEKGNVHVATISSFEQAIEVLQGLWQEPHVHVHESPGEESIPPEILVKTFHGHLGPYVVLGYRMGRYALELTGSEGHFDIAAEVHSPLEPPRSCFIDGVQLGSGCTLGKGNIEVHEYQGPAYVIFKPTQGKILTLRIRPEIPDLITRLIREKGVEEAGEVLLREEKELLFLLDRPSE